MLAAVFARGMQTPITSLLSTLFCIVLRLKRTQKLRVRYLVANLALLSTLMNMFRIVCHLCRCVINMRATYMAELIGQGHCLLLDKHDCMVDDYLYSCASVRLIRLMETEPWPLF